MVVCLFWQTERLASLGGEALAQDIKDHLDDRLAKVEVFSAKDLQIDGPGVTVTRIGGDDSAYRFKYSGLYLLQRSGDKYFLLTDGWDDDAGPAGRPAGRPRQPDRVRALTLHQPSELAQPHPAYGVVRALLAARASPGRGSAGCSAPGSAR